MKRLIATITLIGAVQIITPGQPPVFGYVEKNGDFQYTVPGQGTTYGINQGGGTIMVMPPPSGTSESSGVNPYLVNPINPYTGEQKLK